jgi:hypothetical protein
MALASAVVFILISLVDNKRVHRRLVVATGALKRNGPTEAGP